MHGEIDIPPSGTLFLIGKAGVPHNLSIDHFLLPEWKRPKGLREHLDLRHANGHFTRPGAKQWSLDTDDITKIEMLREPEDVVTQHVTLEVELYAAGRIGEMSKCSFAGRSPAHQ